ncbi:MDR family MFS transporter [Liquorilactobacillus capillatus]|uniref:MFS transporter n=1 Tax=Liquorilactobacillus capillatus DSM 19910 TaxID=1423731 RepID=A0A0R1M8N5_9LACO|nr:MFS transporter [Liquorilactobacillus capillatus]KRL00467.1 MFS transporter [Liquorilactobacillus capillatus DSM 19910]
MKTREIHLSWLLIGSLIASTGTSFVWPLTTVYMHDYLHQSLTTAGIVLALESLVMIGGSYFGGYIYDHLNSHRWLLAAIGLVMLSMFTLIFFNGWPAYPILLIINGFGGAITNTIINSLATSIKKYDSRYVFNMLYFTANIGVVLGTMLVGFVIAINIRYIFAITFVLFFLFFIIAKKFYRNPEKNKQKQSRKEKANTALKTTTRNIIIIALILLTYLAIQIGYSQWQSNLAVYMQTLGIAISKYSLLWTLNGLLIVLGQPVINFIDEHFKVNEYVKIYVGFLLFATAFMSLIFAKDYPHFILSMIIVTVGEVITFPTISSLVNRLSSPDEKGRFQGFVSIAASLGHAVGPLFGGLIIEFGSYEVLFVCMVILVVISGSASLLLTGLRGRKQAK